MLFYNNTILSETQVGGGVEHALAQQPDARAELGAGDPQRHHVHELHLVGLQRLPAESGREVVVSSGALAASGVVADFTGPGHTTRSSTTQRFASLAEYSDGDRAGHAQRAVDYDVFVNVRRLDAQDAAERAEAL